MFNQQEYINNYIKHNYKSIKIRIRNDEKKLIDKLNQVENTSQYIKSLILEDIYKNRQYQFINNNISIDFELSKTMQDLVDKAEEADFIGDYGSYMNLAYAIDSQAKKEVNNHIITETEWKKLNRRYEI